MKKLLAVVITAVFMMGAGLALAKGMKDEYPGPKDTKVEREQEDWRAKRLDRMAKDLNLTPEQKDKIAAIFKENAAKTKAVMDKAKKEMEAIRNTGDKKVKAVLTPEQAKKFDEMKAERQKKIGKERGKSRMEMREKHRHGDGPLMMEEKPVMEKK